MKKFLLLFAIGMLANATEAMAWDSRGHSTIAFIAQRHITPRATANIEKYTDGYSLVYYASWMDFNRKSGAYAVTNDWHVDYWTDDNRKDADGNPLPPASKSQIERIMREMSDFRALDDSTVLINIKYLVHLVGDMHCPSHVDFPTNRPMRVKVDGKDVRYHHIWDGGVAARKHKGMSPTMLAAELDSYDAQRIAAAQAGTVDDWYHQTVAAAAKAMEMLPQGNLTNANYFNAAVNIADTQMRNAGYRLARVLNEIFDK